MFSLILCESIELIKSPSVLFIGFIILCLIYNGWKTSYWYRNGIPGPRSFPFVGNALDIIFKPNFENELDYVERYGKVVGVYHGTQANLIVADPELIRLITVKDFNSFPESFVVPYKSPVEDKFLTNLGGDEWKRVRSLLSPTFTTGKLKKVFTLIKDCMEECIDNLNSSCSSESILSIDAKKFWGKYNMDVTAKCFFALDLKVYSNNSVTLTAQKNFEKVFESNKFASLVNMITPNWFIKLTRFGIFSLEGLTYLSELTHTVIGVRKSKAIETNGTDKKLNDFLQDLLEAEFSKEETVDLNENENINNNIDENSYTTRKGLTTDEIVSSAVIFLIAGYETTSTLLTWTCFELARYPEIQERLYTEIDSLDEINYETINKCVYLDAVINESLRFHPPVIQLPRKCNCNYLIPGTDGAVLPKGSKAFISIYAVHHNPEYYPEPHIFKPERFLPENRESIKPFTFLPFGSGPRLCIGMRFALINTKLALAMFLKNYKLIVNQYTTKKIEYTFHSGVLTAKTINIGIERRYNST